MRLYLKTGRELSKCAASSVCRAWVRVFQAVRSLTVKLHGPTIVQVHGTCHALPVTDDKCGRDETRTRTKA